MPILVTGGAGFVGSNICGMLASQGEEVVSFDMKPQDPPHVAGPRVRSVLGDIASYDSVLQAIRKHGVDRIIAAAAKILGDQEDPLGTFRANVLGLANILEAARREKVERVVSISTAGVYGRSDGLTPLAEDLPMRPEDTYEHTKAQGESLVGMYRERYSLDVRIVRFPFLYGPKQYVVWPLNIVLYHAIEAKLLELSQGGDYALEYLFVKDAALGTILALEAKGAKGETYNIGTGKTTSTFEVARAVKNLCPSFEYEIGPGLWPSEILNAWRRGPLDISKAEEIGYRPKYGINEGLRELDAWERTHPDEYRKWPKNELWIV